MGDNELKAGTTLIITSGSYSDYGITDIVCAKRDFHMQVALDEFRRSAAATSSEMKDGPYGETQAFLQWLRDEGYADGEVNATEVHVGDYGRLELGR